MRLRRPVLGFLACSVLVLSLTATTAGAQPLGAFRWQLTPFCNVVTVNVTLAGGVYTLDGFDDQCGAAARASLTGTAFPNPDGSIGLGFSIVAAPGAGPVHVGVALNLATLSGTWRDSAGSSGAFTFNPPPLGAGAPRPAGGGVISTVVPGAGLVGGGAAGPVSLAVDFAGPGSAPTAARSDHTHAAPGTDNTRIGAGALAALTSGGSNTAIGPRTLAGLTSGADNLALGPVALNSLTTGIQNTAIGGYSQTQIQTGAANTSVGFLALNASTTSHNTALGNSALRNNVSGSLNTAVGSSALWRNTAGSTNTAVGQSALDDLLIGSDNIAIGYQAGNTVTSAENSIYIGAPAASTAEANTVRIGNANHLQTFVRGIYGQPVVAASGTFVYVDSAGKLGTVDSSARFKQDIRKLDDTDSAVLRLEPVSFRYRAEEGRGNAMEYGLIAEQVAEVMPELVIRDDDGQPRTVKYQHLPTLLLAEVQRLERERAAQAAEIKALREEMRALRERR